MEKGRTSQRSLRRNRAFAGGQRGREQYPLRGQRGLSEAGRERPRRAEGREFVGNREWILWIPGGLLVKLGLVSNRASQMQIAGKIPLSFLFVVKLVSCDLDFLEKENWIWIEINLNNSILVFDLKQ